MNVVELIRSKRDGGALADDEIARASSRGVTDGSDPRLPGGGAAHGDLLPRARRRASSARSPTRCCTRATCVDLSDIPGAKVDKHSTGGVGDKISLHLAPAVAACGVRGADDLRARPRPHRRHARQARGDPRLPRRPRRVDDFAQVLARRAAWRSSARPRGSRPPTSKLYALRDVTGTVECIPLIAASIMSKKLAEGIDGLVLDVKVGSGAFMKTLERARELARDAGRHRAARRQARHRVLDRHGPAARPLDRQRGRGPRVDRGAARARASPTCVELTLALGGEMLRARRRGQERRRRARSASRARSTTARRSSASALRRRCRAARRARQRAALVPRRRTTRGRLPAPARFVTRIDAEALGIAALALGAGRARKEDAIDPRRVVVAHARRSASASSAGEPVALRSRSRATRAMRGRRCASVIERGVQRRRRARRRARPLVLEVIR